MLSKAPLHASSSLQGGFKYGIYSSARCVHWYHSAKAVGAPRDQYELFNRQREFGQGEIGDKERYPHLYWNLWKGRTVLQRVVQQWGYSKDFKPEQLRRDAEKLAYFMKLDDLDFLEQTRAEYSFVDDDAKNAVGYITDDEDDEIMDHEDYGKLYVNASNEYKQLILEDHCDGRPVYEWQIPYGMDQVYQYKSISTAVDVISNETALENITMNWREGGAQSDVGGKGSILLTNENTQQQILLCDEHDASETIKQWTPETVVIQCGADKLLSQMNSTMAPTNRTDLYGCAISFVWSSLFFMSPLFPSNVLLGGLTMSGLIALNSLFFYRTFMHPTDQILKKIFKSVRKTNSNLVLGDWLIDDYDERLHQVSQYDELANQMFNVKDGEQTMLSGAIGSSLTKLNEDEKEDHLNVTGSFMELFNNISQLGKGTNLHEKQLKAITVDDIGNENWMKTYRDAINNRRIDLLAHVLNNCQGNKILMSVSNIDNISPNIVQMLLQRRLTGDININKSVLKYDTYYERVSVDI